jgi:hypothetical protein
MQIRKRDKSYNCTEVEIKPLNAIFRCLFSITEPITSSEIADLFEDTTFYFYDDVSGVRLTETNNTKMVGLRINYNADSTCKIEVRLKKGAVDNESQV